MDKKKLERCPTCGANVDIDSKIVYTAVGQMTASEFATKACYFAKNKTCINPAKTGKEKCSWETFKGLDKKGEEVLRGNMIADDYYKFVNLYNFTEEDIDYLKLPGEERY